MIKLKSGIILSEVEEDSEENSNAAIFVDTNSGKYLSINRVALNMIRAAIKAENENEAIAALSELYNIDPQILAHDLRDLIGRLDELDLIDSN